MAQASCTWWIANQPTNQCHCGVWLSVLFSDISFFQGSFLLHAVNRYFFSCLPERRRTLLDGIIEIPVYQCPLASITSSNRALETVEIPTLNLVPNEFENDFRPDLSGRDRWTTLTSTPNLSPILSHLKGAQSGTPFAQLTRNSCDLIEKQANENLTNEEDEISQKLDIAPRDWKTRRGLRLLIDLDDRLISSKPITRTILI